MRIAESYLDDEDSFLIDDWGEEYSLRENMFLADLSDGADSSPFLHFDDLDELESELIDFADGDDVDESGGSFMSGMAEAAPELTDSLREVLHERYSDASDEELEEALENLFGGMSAAEGFNFGKVLKSIGRGATQILRDPVVSQIAKTALPIAGGALGTFVGGPVGTALGSQLGNLAGSAFGSRRPSQTNPRRRVKPVRQVHPHHRGIIRQNPAGGSNAAAQLLQLTQNPSVLKSLLSLALGNSGRETVNVETGKAVPVGSFMTLLKTLSTEAASDAEVLARETSDSSSYLLDEDGEYIVDPAVPEARAAALYETLIGIENGHFADSVEALDGDTLGAADGEDWIANVEDSYVVDEDYMFDDFGSDDADYYDDNLDSDDAYYYGDEVDFVDAEYYDYEYDLGGDDYIDDINDDLYLDDEFSDNMYAGAIYA